MTIQNSVTKLKVNSSHFYTRMAAFIGITAALIGPVLLLTNGGRELRHLPWYAWTVLSVLLLLAIIIGILMFKRISHDTEDISISPDRR